MQLYEEFTGGFTKAGRKVSDLSRIGTLLEALGNPQDGLKFVHIAGTNGKGSCAEMTAGMLTATGYRTGLFTSPYILRYNDRIRIDGEDISDSDLNLLASEVAPHARRLAALGFSQFEITQALAFLYFSRKCCDIVVLEAGVGGRLDSTNIIAPPEVAVICSVSLDHTAVLGNTVEEIARQKAGIIKHGTAAVLAPENPQSVEEIIRQRVQTVGGSVVIPDISKLGVKRCTPFGCDFEYFGKSYETSMGGYHQIKNALTVIETAGVLRKKGFEIPQAAIFEGIKSAHISGRIQVISRKPLVIVDGGHNPDGVKALADALALLDCKKRIVIGMLGDKDSDSAAEFIAKAADSFICVDGFYPNARPKNELANLLRRHGANACASPFSAEETVKHELETLGDDEALIISGSLYLAAKFAK